MLWWELKKERQEVSQTCSRHRGQPERKPAKGTGDLYEVLVEDQMLWAETWQDIRKEREGGTEPRRALNISVEGDCTGYRTTGEGI